VKDHNGDLLADSHNTLNRWKDHFSQLLNVPRVSDVKKIEIHTAEPLVPDPSLLSRNYYCKFEKVQIAINRQVLFKFGQN
jgi:hypothetical protein